MVDFKKRLSGKKAERPTDPVALYDTLDRAHDKGPLRPAQIAVLREWFKKNQSTKDVIVKLHTGQGKTLIGLLMLQSRLNGEHGPAVYFCPDNFLIGQTRDQAKQFGISTCAADPHLPGEFLNGERILVTSVQKLFNGLTKFGLNNNSILIDTVLMDDAHACADTIREQCRIRIPRTEPAYDALKTLFAADLETQGVGTYAEINNDKREAFLPVPYWAWGGREVEVAGILANNSARDSIKFAWPLLKNMLGGCQCVVSGSAVEIEPYIAPLAAFGSYWKAQHRVFMSATVTDDAFLVKGLQLLPETITAPLTYENETWSGEKMVLLPSLIHEELDRELLVKTYGPANTKRSSGVVALAPSFGRTKDWEGYGAEIATKDTVGDMIDNLKSGTYEKTVVLVNRYDGIDLPDDACRILVFDSKPYSESLIDLYQESCRSDSAATLMRTVRTVEQGMGRSVRGQKDYCVVIVIGPDLVRLVRDKRSREYLSPQMAKQIEVGLEIGTMARQEIDEGKKSGEALNGLIRQCLGRDADWKAFYIEQMDTVKPRGATDALLLLYKSELEAEQLYVSGDGAAAAKRVQALLDVGETSPDDRGWYLQEMARYHHRADRQESLRLQLAAHRSNRLLLKPTTGVIVDKLTVVSQGRVERIAKWLGVFSTYAEVDVSVSDILGRLVFGTRADKFEHALDELSRALGYAGERPDKEWKEGPDNLWALDATQYILWECKSQVDVNRKEINKREAEQMNRSSAWFDKHYGGANVRRIIVHPAHEVQSAASFTHDVEVTREPELRKLVRNVRSFFKSFEKQNLKDLSTSHIQSMLNAHGLGTDTLLKDYAKKPKDLK